MISFIIGILIGLLKGLIDGSTSHPKQYEKFIEKYNWLYKIGLWYRSFFDPNEWKNKYKNKDKQQGEAFWGSTRWFVFLTDRFHFFSFLVINSIALILWCTINIYQAIGWRIGVWVGFHLSYR